VCVGGGRVGRGRVKAGGGGGELILREAPFSIEGEVAYACLGVGWARAHAWEGEGGG
jgi:hypothetical protein